MIGGANRAAYLGNIASRCYIPWHFFAGNNQVMSRTVHTAMDSITALQVLYPNWYVDNPGGTFTELGVGATASLKVGIEYPLGSLPATQFLFSSSATGSAVNGANFLSDALSIAIPKGAQFALRPLYTNSAGVTYSQHASSAYGDRANFAVSGLADQTLTGTIADGASGYSYAPLAVLAQTTRQSALILGDSRVDGKLDTYDSAGDLGEVARSLGPGFAYINGGVDGDSALKFAASHTKRVALATYCSDGIITLGVNDNLTVAATVMADLTTGYSALAAQNTAMRIWGATIGPKTTSSDSWATVGNQTISSDPSTLNDLIRAKPSPLFGYLEIADAAMSARNSGKWKAPAHTNDGIHGLQKSALAIRDSGAVWL